LTKRRMMKHPTLSPASGSKEKCRSLPMPRVAEDLGGGGGEVVEGQVEASCLLRPRRAIIAQQLVVPRPSRPLQTSGRILQCFTSGHNKPRSTCLWSHQERGLYSSKSTIYVFENVYHRLNV
jgi:hypothetical protein